MKKKWPKQAKKPGGPIKKLHIIIAIFNFGGNNFGEITSSNNYGGNITFLEINLV